MISISAKLCTKPIAHSKSYITHTLLVTVLSLVREAVRIESSGSCSGETLIPVPQVCEEQQVKPLELNVKMFYLILFFNLYTIGYF